MDNNEMLTERIVVLETEGKTKDREIKELKGKVDNLNTLFNGQALTTQSILSKVDNLAEKFNPIILYIEELKTQPKKDRDKFLWIIISLALGAIGTALGYYFKK